MARSKTQLIQLENGSEQGQIVATNGSNELVYVGGGTEGQVPTKDATGAIVFDDPTKVNTNSLSYINLNSSNELVILDRLITRVVVDNTAADLNSFVTANYTGTEFQESDLILLENPSLTYVHNGGNAGDTSDFSVIAGGSGSVTLTNGSGTTVNGSAIDILGSLDKNADLNLGDPAGTNYEFNFTYTGAPAPIITVTVDSFLFIRDTTAVEFTGTQIRFLTNGVAPTVNQVWTSQGTNGSGNWADLPTELPQDVAAGDITVYNGTDWVKATNETNTQIITGTSITLPSTPLELLEVNVYFNGHLMEEGTGNDYTRVGDTITWEYSLTNAKITTKYYIA